MISLKQTILCVSDLQYPYHDKKVWRAVLQFARQLDPTGVIINGDGYDFYDLSQFDKNPARLGRLQKELDHFKVDILDSLLNAAPHASTRIYTEGNHEERVQKYLWHQAPALSGLRDMRVETLLHLPETGFRYCQKPVEIGPHLLVLHGHIVNKHAGWSAKSHYERYGKSLVIGHTHRIGTYMVRDWRGVHEAVEQGCLCNLEPEYVQHPNWQQGFCVIQVYSDRSFSIQIVKVINRKFLLYGAERIVI